MWDFTKSPLDAGGESVSFRSSEEDDEVSSLPTSALSDKLEKQTTMNDLKVKQQVR